MSSFRIFETLAADRVPVRVVMYRAYSADLENPVGETTADLLVFEYLRLIPLWLFETGRIRGEYSPVPHFTDTRSLLLLDDGEFVGLNREKLPRARRWETYDFLDRTCALKLWRDALPEEVPVELTYGQRLAVETGQTGIKKW